MTDAPPGMSTIFTHTYYSEQPLTLERIHAPKCPQSVTIPNGQNLKLQHLTCAFEIGRLGQTTIRATAYFAFDEDTHTLYYWEKMSELEAEMLRPKDSA